MRKYSLQSQRNKRASKPAMDDWRAARTRCHDLFESHRIRNESGELLPHLTLENALWCKADDPFDKYDPAFLQELRGKSALPEPEPLPEIFYDLRAYWSM